MAFSMSGSESDSMNDDATTSTHHSARQPLIRACEQQPPLYQIEMSQAPGIRYLQICTDYAHEISQLAQVYNEILAYTPTPRIFRFLSRVCLTKVFSREETAEIKGIAHNVGIPLHLVVAYNTFLDLFSGCMSGGARVGARAGTTKMIHFRNLDWEMEPLRDMIIRVEYLVGGRVVAREGLSISLNYRARIQSKSWTISNRIHQLLLLLGKRPSISSQLRQILLSPGPPPTLLELSNKFRRTKASPCYLTFCSPSSVLVVEKDLNSAVTFTSDAFFAVTNHDAAMEICSQDRWRRFLEGETRTRVADIVGTRDIIKDSIERKQLVCSLWSDHELNDTDSNRPRSLGKVCIDDIKTWLRTYPIRNECTHFCCVMDPSAPGGGLLWVESCEVI